MCKHNNSEGKANTSCIVRVVFSSNNWATGCLINPSTLITSGEAVQYALGGIGDR